MEITDKELKELAEKEAIDMWGHYSTGELHRAYFIDAYTKGFREALKQVKNNGVLDDVSDVSAPKEVKFCMKSEINLGSKCKEYCGSSWCDCH